MASLEASSASAVMAATGDAAARPSSQSAATVIVAPAALAAASGASAVSGTADEAGRDVSGGEPARSAPNFADLFKKRSFRSEVVTNDTVVFGDDELVATSSRRTATSLYIKRPGAKVPTDSETRSMIWERFGRFGLCFVCPSAGSRFFLLAFETAEKARQAVDAAGCFQYREDSWQLDVGIGLPRSKGNETSRLTLTDKYGPGYKVFIYRLPFWLGKEDLELCLRALPGVTHVKVLWSSLNSSAHSVGVGYATAYLHGLGKDQIPERVKVKAGEHSAYFYIRHTETKKAPVQPEEPDADAAELLQRKEPAVDTPAPSPAGKRKLSIDDPPEGDAPQQVLAEDHGNPAVVIPASSPVEESPVAPSVDTTTITPQGPPPKRPAGSGALPSQPQLSTATLSNEEGPWTTVGRAEKRPPSRPHSPSSPRSINSTLTTGYYDVLASAAVGNDNSTSQQETPGQPARKLAAVNRSEVDEMDVEMEGPAAWQSSDEQS